MSHLLLFAGPCLAPWQWKWRGGVLERGKQLRTLDPRPEPRNTASAFPCNPTRRQPVSAYETKRKKVKTIRPTIHPFPAFPAVTSLRQNRTIPVVPGAALVRGCCSRGKGCRRTAISDDMWTASLDWSQGCCGNPLVLSSDGVRRDGKVEIFATRDTERTRDRGFKVECIV